VRAAVALRDVVGEAQHLFVIAVVPFQRDIDADVVAFAVNGDRRGNQRGFRLVEIFDERRDAPFVVKLDRLLFGVARIGEMQAYAGIEEGELTEAMLELGEIELDDLESRRAGR
jgi:hypothetical protein